MKKTMVLILGLMLMGINLYAADGDLIVNGNVGIGTASPGAKLAVDGGIIAEGAIRTTGDAGYSSGMNFYTSTINRGFVGWRNTGSTIPFNATGVYLFNTDNSNLILGTNNLERLRIDTNGNVGIGTISPGARLDVVAGTTGRFQFLNPSSNVAKLNVISPVDSSVIDYQINAWTHQFLVNGNEMVRIDNTGNVGIGTTAPGSKLEVYGAINSYDGSNGYFYSYSHGASAYKPLYVTGNDLYLNTATTNGAGTSTTRVTILNTTGNVGIGTTNPGYTLDVNGTVSASVKAFDIKDPRYNDEKKRLVHTSLEGPEVGVYYRGEVKLEQGKATVSLPDYFEALTRKENRTVILTAKFEREDELICNVAASEVTGGVFNVKAFGMSNTTGCNHKVFWEVKAERSDVAKHTVERLKEDPPVRKVNLPGSGS